MPQKRHRLFYERKALPKQVLQAIIESFFVKIANFKMMANP